ncbi:hypothetical protein NKH57_31035 [Mesorhizobium sp. M1050]|uniref:hypothetical protein n=1 Tax=Mesorhizobium sp. M1050 TaxID=2957051 RepID=UPI0033382F64
MAELRSRLDTIGTLAIVAGYVTMAGAMPVTLLMYQGYDDGLFIRLAKNIAQGAWLGPYDQLTLVKGPGYPTFLALNSITGFPINITEVALYGFACLLFSRVVSAIFDNRRWAYYFALITMLACPSMYLYKDRVTRELFYSSITLILISLWINIFICNRDTFNKRTAFVAGGLLFLFWITREEAVWIVPTLMLIAIFPAIRSNARGWRKILGPASANVAVILLSTAICTGVIASINLAKYGSTTILEMTSSDFQSAMRQLQRVGAPYSRAYVPVPKEARSQIYAVSPSFASLRNYLESPPNAATCNLLPTTCGDIAGGWFMWAFRDAAARAGYHRSPATAAQFYESVAREVSAGCSNAKLVCASYSLPLIPHITREQWELVPDRVSRTIGIIDYAAPFAIEPPPSVAHPDDAMALSILNDPPLVAPDGSIQLSATRMLVYGLWKKIIYAAAYVMKFAIPVAGIAFVASFIIGRRRFHDPVNYIVVSLILGIFARSVILILIDISSFPAIYYPRFGLTSLLVSAATVLSIVQVMVMILNKRPMPFPSAIESARTR